MSLKFTKMNGLGNDFIVIDAINQQVQLTTQQIAKLADRHTGIGFDQCLLLEKSQSTDTDFFYRIFNANGQEVGQCGNGARCLMRFIHHQGLSRKKNITIATKTTRMKIELNADDSVTVHFEPPQWTPEKIPFNATIENDRYELPLSNGLTYLIHAVSVGNPHAVTTVDDIDTLDVQTIGQAISEHPLFPEQCNASFMQIINPNTIRLRVYDRGCGETAACGSAAIAASAVGRRFYGLSPRIHVALTGGELIVDWPTTDESIQLTGPATFVYEGTLFPCVLSY